MTSPTRVRKPAAPPSSARSWRASRFTSAGVRRRGGDSTRRWRARSALAQVPRRGVEVRRAGAVVVFAAGRRAAPWLRSAIGRPPTAQRRGPPPRIGRRARRRRRTDPSSRRRGRAARRPGGSPARTRPAHRLLDRGRRGDGHDAGENGLDLVGSPPRARPPTPGWPRRPAAATRSCPLARPPAISTASRTPDIAASAACTFVALELSRNRTPSTSATASPRCAAGANVASPEATAAGIDAERDRGRRRGRGVLAVPGPLADRRPRAGRRGRRCGRSAARRRTRPRRLRGRRCRTSGRGTAPPRTRPPRRGRPGCRRGRRRWSVADRSRPSPPGRRRRSRDGRGGRGRGSPGPTPRDGSSSAMRAGTRRPRPRAPRAARGPPS